MRSISSSRRAFPTPYSPNCSCNPELRATQLSAMVITFGSSSLSFTRQIIYPAGCGHSLASMSLPYKRPSSPPPAYIPPFPSPSRSNTKLSISRSKARMLALAFFTFFLVAFGVPLNGGDSSGVMARDQSAESKFQGIDWSKAVNDCNSSQLAILERASWVAVTEMLNPSNVGSVGGDNDFIFGWFFGQPKRWKTVRKGTHVHIPTDLSWLTVCVCRHRSTTRASSIVSRTISSILTTSSGRVNNQTATRMSPNASSTPVVRAPPPLHANRAPTPTLPTPLRARTVSGPSPSVPTIGPSWNTQTDCGIKRWHHACHPVN